MSSRDEDASSDAQEAGEDGEEVIEERKEYITNPDGSVTVKTIKVISTYVEEEEEEEEEGVKEEEEEEEGVKEEEKEVPDNGRPPMPSFSSLSKDEMEDFMRFAAEKQLMAKMEKAGFVPREDEREEEREERNDEEGKGKKKKKRPDADKKGKKKKRRDGKENKRDDILAKHVGPRVRSFDSAKMKTKFEKPKDPAQVSSDCKACGKQVFQMEKVVAEKAAWHKNCFRCKECNKNLTLETYQSHEGVLYCKPHFKELFRPKAVVEDPTEARKERLARRPKLIVLESNPEELPEDVVRATSKPDYGLEELAQLNVKQRFSLFERPQQDEEVKLEPVAVRRSQSMINRAARFLADNDSLDYGVDNAELGDYDDDEEDEEDEDEELAEEEEEGEDEGVDENGEPIKAIKKKKKKMGGLQDALEQRSRREQMSKTRKEELGRFRQMLCAGKNTTLKEKFETGQFENEDKEKTKTKEEIKIDEKRAARSLRAKFEKGQPFILDDDMENDLGHKHVSEKEEVEEIFKEAETANRARNLFKHIDSKVNQDGSAALLRSQSFASTGRENRRSIDAGRLQDPQTPTGDIVRCHDPLNDDPHAETEDLASKFMFFATFEKRQKQEAEKKRKVFRITPPREEQGLATEDIELGRDPNLIRSTDNYQDEVDCRKTKSILTMFKKMEAKNTSNVDDEDEDSEGEDYDDEYTDEEGEYTDEEDDYTDEEDGDEERPTGSAPYKDELLQMSARKAAELRAKFEKWELEETRHNEANKSNGAAGEDEEAMPSLDTARNLKAMFEEKAQEAAKPQVRERAKVNRFV